MKSSTARTAVLTSGAVAALCLSSVRTGFFSPGARLSRRTLIKLGGLGAATLFAGAWKSDVSAASAGTTSVPAASCVLSPEQTEGPYYIPKEKVRSNIVEKRRGTPLKLRFSVVDAATCKPIKGAAVDIWHCDSGGIYSGFEAASTGGPPGRGGGPTDTHTFLRGIQFTDSKGLCQFETIYPGWYRGRTVHIHVKVHLNHDSVAHVVHTGQLYFSDSLTAQVYRAQPYRARAAARDTFNNTDGIFQSGGRQSMLSMKRDGKRGYVGSIALGVRRS